MSKSVTNQRLIYKINSSRFSVCNWNLTLDFDMARKNEEVVSLGDSQGQEMIRQISNNTTKKIIHHFFSFLRGVI